jgi:hypothetical protein
MKVKKSYMFNLLLSGAFAPVTGSDLKLKDNGLFLGKKIIGINTPSSDSLNAPIELPPGAVLMSRAELAKIALTLKDAKEENKCYQLPLTGTIQPTSGAVKKLFYEVDFLNVDLNKSSITILSALTALSPGQDYFLSIEFLYED